MAITMYDLTHRYLCIDKHVDPSPSRSLEGGPDLKDQPTAKGWDEGLLYQVPPRKAGRLVRR